MSRILVLALVLIAPLAHPSAAGQVTQVDADKDLTPAFVSILGEFRDRYVLSYSPEGVRSPGWHELAVTVKGKPVKVTARRGYVAQ